MDKVVTGPAPPSQQERVPEAKQLRRAAGTIARVIPGLNAENGTCESCGRRHDVNYTEAEAARQFKRMVKQLRHWAYLFENGKSLLEERHERAAARGNGGEEEPT